MITTLMILALGVGDPCCTPAGETSNHVTTDDDGLVRIGVSEFYESWFAVQVKYHEPIVVWSADELLWCFEIERIDDRGFACYWLDQRPRPPGQYTVATVVSSLPLTYDTYSDNYTPPTRIAGWCEESIEPQPLRELTVYGLDGPWVVQHCIHEVDNLDGSFRQIEDATVVRLEDGTVIVADDSSDEAWAFQGEPVDVQTEASGPATLHDNSWGIVLIHDGRGEVLNRLELDGPIGDSCDVACPPRLKWYPCSIGPCPSKQRAACYCGGKKKETPFCRCVKNRVGDDRE